MSACVLPSLPDELPLSCASIVRSSCAVQLKIAYRVYTRNGDQEDSKGRYRGWSSEYDEWIPVTAAYKYRFAKFNTRVVDPLDEPVDDATDPPFAPCQNPPPRLSKLAATVVVRCASDGECP